MRWRPLVREAPREPAPRPRGRGVAKVIRALCYLRDSAKGARAEIERELAYFRKHRHRMRYHALKEEGIAIGSGVWSRRPARRWWYSA